MGSSCSSFARTQPEDLNSNSLVSGLSASSKAITSKWRKALTKRAVRALYEADGTIPVGCDDGLLSLRVYLADQLSLRQFGEYARSKDKSIELLMCWTEIFEYKDISSMTLDYQLSVAKHLIHKYFVDPVVAIPDLVVDENYQRMLSEAVASAESGTTVLSIHLFDEFHQKCLQLIYTKLFVSYLKTSMFVESLKGLKNNYNVVTADDFEYFEMLGEGGFGFVVHVKKKSTGVHYAMKIQRKIGLLNVFADVPHRVSYEKEALVQCHHPYIVNLDYAFQDNTLVFLVMDLGTVGTLMDVVNALGRMTEEKVRFYIAEIALALNHVHELGLIYRDLKPSNVLLNSNGHIQLVDLGGIVDTGNNLLGIAGGGRSSGGVGNDPYATLGRQAQVFDAALTLGSNPTMGILGGNSHFSLFGSSSSHVMGGITGANDSTGPSRHMSPKALPFVASSGSSSPNKMNVCNNSNDHGLNKTEHCHGDIVCDTIAESSGSAVTGSAVSAQHPVGTVDETNPTGVTTGTNSSQQSSIPNDAFYLNAVTTIHEDESTPEQLDQLEMLSPQSQNGGGLRGVSGARNRVRTHSHGRSPKASYSYEYSDHASGGGGGGGIDDDSCNSLAGEKAQSNTTVLTDQQVINLSMKVRRPSGGGSNSNGPNSFSGESEFAFGAKSFGGYNSARSLGRAKSVMGTTGYMAPEVLAMDMADPDAPGYTKAVDYWSLGVTMFTLLHGTVPFQQAHLMSFVEGLGMATDAMQKATCLLEFEKYITAVMERSLCPPSCHRILCHLMEPADQKRLGYGHKGFGHFRHHPFFSTVNWSRLQLKLVEPPAIVAADLQRNVLVDKPPFVSFDSMMTHFGCSHWRTEPEPVKQQQLPVPVQQPPPPLTAAEASQHYVSIDEPNSSMLPAATVDVPITSLSSEKQQQLAEVVVAEKDHFSHWNYVSPRVLAAELGIQADVEKYNETFKVKSRAAAFASIKAALSVAVSNQLSVKKQR